MCVLVFIRVRVRSMVATARRPARSADMIPRPNSITCTVSFFFQAEDGIRDIGVTGVQTCALPIFLVHGGSSGIGTMAIQLAARAGARVLTTAGSAAKLAVCRELGAEVGINYREEDFVERVKAATDGRGVDVVLDNMGAKYLAGNVDALAVGGRLVVIGMQGGTRAELDLGVLMRKRASVHATTLRSRPATGRGSKAEIVAAVRHDVWPDVERGVVRPIVDRRLPMSRAGEAHALVESSGHVGKVLLLPAD